MTNTIRVVSVIKEVCATRYLSADLFFDGYPQF